MSVPLERVQKKGVIIFSIGDVFIRSDVVCQQFVGTASLSPLKVVHVSNERVWMKRGGRTGAASYRVDRRQCVTTAHSDTGGEPCRASTRAR